MTMQKTTNILFLALMLIHLSISTDNSSSTLIPIKNCQFSIIPPEDNLTFIYCITPDKRQDQKWSQCMEICCSMKGSQYSTPNYTTLKQCQNKNYNIDKTSSIMIIGVSVVATLIFIGLTIIICKILKLCFGHKVIQDEQITIENIEEIKKLSSNMYEILWIKVEDNDNISIESTCSICLQASCYTSLRCRHVYHPQCIGMWFLKSNFCPNCHEENIKVIKEYCSHCFQYYFLIRKNPFLRDLPKTKGLKCSHCKIDEEKIDHDRVLNATSQNLFFVG